jgi:hypothetical protein
LYKEEEEEKKDFAIVTDDKVERKPFNTKETHKKFKEDCQQCGQQGHNAADCNEKMKVNGANESNNSKGNGDHFKNPKFFNCNNKGHIAAIPWKRSQNRIVSGVQHQI